MSIRALALISGGLDSMLAAKLIMAQGIQVEGINFFTGFTGDWIYPEISCPYRKRDAKNNYSANWICEQLGIKLHLIDVVEEFKSVLLNPQYGYGANINPCLDCKLFMIAQAKKWMEQNGFSFLVSGEVVGQRPMSQRKDTLPLAVKIADDLIVRPLSAKHLAPSLPEREGWINRELLGDISGRSRKPQIELAQKFGFKEFPQPAGGCILTDENFCGRLQDLWQHRGHKNYSLDDVLLLRVGRHLRISSELKLIIGRDENENNFLARYQDKTVTFEVIDYPGAKVLVDGRIAANEALIAQIAAHFSKGKNAGSVKVLMRLADRSEQIFVVTPATSNEIKQWV